jgi:serine/threonine protein kinase
VDGNIVGTLHYLSPEQLRGGKIDLRSDIYSLGAILYEMATGAKTFPQKDITELTMQRAANNFKPPNEYDTPVTPAVSNIILKCLKTSPQERYRHVAELIRDLQKAYAEIAPKCAPQKMLHDFFSEDTAETGITPTVLINVDTDTDYAVDATSVIDKDSVVDTDFIVNTDPIVDNDPFIVNNDSVIDDDHVIINTDSIIDIDSIVDINPITNDDPIIVDTDSFVDDNHIIVNTDSVVDTDNIIDDDPIIDTVDHSKPTFKLSTRIIPPTKRTIAYATITLLTLLSASYITIKLISHPSPKPANKQTNANATATFTNSLPTPINTDTNVITSENILPTVNTHTSESAANAVNSADLNATVIDTADVNNAAVNTADTNTTDVHAIDVNTANINTKAAAPAPAPTENAIIKSALEAIDRHEWDRAIRILEKGGPAFTEKRGERHLLLFEAYVESRQLEKARSVFDSAAKTNDALYFLTAGRYMFYRGDHAGALATLEASLTRSSAMRGRNAIFGDAMYYIAMIMSDRFRTSPTEANRRQAQEAWRRVRSAYESIPESPRFKRAETEILELY